MTIPRSRRQNEVGEIGLCRLNRPLNPESINTLIQAAVTRADLDPLPCSAHRLRAGFVTYALPSAWVAVEPEAHRTARTRKPRD